MSRRHQPRRWRHRSLFWKIFFHGVLLTAAVVAASILAFHGLGGASQWHRMLHNTSAWLGDSLVSNNPDLQSKVDGLSSILEADMAVFQLDGTKLAGASELSALPKRQVEQLTAQPKPIRIAPHLNALPLQHEGKLVGYALTDHSFKHQGGRFALVLLTALGVIILLSAPLGRSISGPLERLTQTAQKLAAGDLTARTQFQRRDEVGVLADTIDQMADRLETLLHQQKELLANVSHELRTPLSRLTVALELCESQNNIEEIRKQMSGMAGDTHELRQLIDDVLDVSRLELGQVDFENGPLQLKRDTVTSEDLARSALEQFGRRHPGRTVDLQQSAPSATISVDPALCKRLLVNLLDNAAKYSEAPAPIELALRHEPEQLTVEVSDRGEGVADEDLPRLFDPFFRTDRSRAKTVAGTGLGLTLCKRISEAHGGAIEASNRDGGGLTVVAHLPT